MRIVMKLVILVLPAVVAACSEPVRNRTVGASCESNQECTSGNCVTAPPSGGTSGEGESSGADPGGNLQQVGSLRPLGTCAESSGATGTSGGGPTGTSSGGTSSGGGATSEWETKFACFPVLSPSPRKDRSACAECPPGFTCVQQRLTSYVYCVRPCTTDADCKCGDENHSCGSTVVPDVSPVVAKSCRKR